MRLYVFDDRRAGDWAPFALTRPVAELRYGRWLLRERLERFAGVRASGSLARPWLFDFREPGAAAVVHPEDVPHDEGRLVVCARTVPADGITFHPPEGAANLRINDQVVGCWLPPGHPLPGAAWLGEPEPLSRADEIRLEGELLEAPWDLVAGNAERLARDLRRLAKSTAEADAATALPAGVERLGREPVRLGRGTRLEPGVLLDARDGPIALDERVEVLAGGRLAGPIYAGPDSRLLGGPISSLSTGPRSYLRGEIEETVVLGYTNKAHDGFLGHAYLGRWVNLGALTTNSDLKNNYGTVRVGPPGQETDTGLLKVGCFLGDHVKTGIGLMLNTGAVVGAGSNLFGTTMPPKWVPPFSWGEGADLGEYRKEAFLATAETVMGRREVTFDAGTRAWLSAVWEAGRKATPAGFPAAATSGEPGTGA